VGDLLVGIFGQFAEVLALGVVYADGNPSWAPLVTRYRRMLRDDATFGASTFDELVESGAFEAEVRATLVERYRCW
jgi:hypothetical protein